MTEKTINEFLKEMAAEGFNFNFRATNGSDIFNGTCSNGVLKVKRQLSQDEIKQKISEKLSSKSGERKSEQSTPTYSKTLRKVM